jgi:predicted lactoylglutathione lyase
MSTKVFINLPTQNLEKATAFYEAIGFTKNPKFSDENASGLSYNDEFYVMLLTHKFAKTFLPHKQIADSHTTCEVLNAIQLDSREAVDQLIKKVIAA